jgi:hypothetical protein
MIGGCAALLRQPETRLLTLTGAGGSGKTRNAVQAAAEVFEDHEHGVWWVRLQAVREPEGVGPAIGSALGAQGDLAKHVGTRRMLLVLDNFEQVSEAAPVLGELLATCPNSRLLVCRREKYCHNGGMAFAHQHGGTSRGGGPARGPRSPFGSVSSIRRPAPGGEEDRMAGFLFRLETPEGVTAEPPTIGSAVPNWKPGDTIPVVQHEDAPLLPGAADRFNVLTRHLVGTAAIDGQPLQVVSLRLLDLVGLLAVVAVDG